jgi:hypothetical protein
MVITRQEAIERGLNKYYTGEPCVNGHIAERYVKNGECVECKKEQQERARIKRGILPRDERNKKRKEAVNRKIEKSKKYQESILTAEERKILKYARKCLKHLVKSGVWNNTHKIIIRDKYNGSWPYRDILEELESGYSEDILYKHLSSQNKQWSRHLNKNKGKWHIDHIIPLSKLIKRGVTEISILNSLDNLRLTTASRNLKKGTKLNISIRELDDFINRKRQQSNSPPLGIYNPSERVEEIVVSEAIRIYPVVKSELNRTEFSIKQNKNAVINAIKSDIYIGYYYYFDSGSPKEGWVEYCKYPTYEDSELYQLIISEHRPLIKLKRKNFKDINSFTFFPETRCKGYYDQLMAKESDPICRRYLYNLRKNNCKKD